MYTLYHLYRFEHLSGSFSICPHLLAAPLLHAVRSPTSPTSASPVTLRPAKPVEPVKPIPQKLAVAMQNPPVSELSHFTSSLTRSANMRPDVPERTGPVSSWHRQHILTIHGNPLNTSIPILYCVIYHILEEHPSTSWDSPGNQGFHPRVRNGRACVQPQIHPYTAQRAFRIIQDHSGSFRHYHLATLVHTPFAENTLVVADWTRSDRSETKYLTCTPR
jgi:hypothetical protein